MCFHTGSADPFTEHRQSWFGILVEDPRIFRTMNECWIQLKSPATLAPNKRVSLFFDPLKPEADFSFLVVQVLDDFIQ